jgi:hypothetical protein
MICVLVHRKTLVRIRIISQHSKKGCNMELRCMKYIRGLNDSRSETLSYAYKTVARVNSSTFLRNVPPELICTCSYS